MTTDRPDIISAAEAARRLGIGRKTFERRRKQGHPAYQPHHVDTDNGRRSYSWTEIKACLEEAGRRRAS